MTNNHVLKNAAEAAAAFAEFDYEEDKVAFEVSIQPDRFFVTSEVRAFRSSEHGSVFFQGEYESEVFQRECKSIAT